MVAVKTEVKNSMTQAIFSELLDQCFTARTLSGESIELQLVEVKPLRASEGSPNQEPYSLLFRGPADSSLSQQTFRLQHEVAGTFSLFLTRVMGQGEGSFFEAIFN